MISGERGRVAGGFSMNPNCIWARMFWSLTSPAGVVSVCPQLPESAWFEAAPDWVCEILSPSTARTDRILKMPIYAREGVAHLWLVDPDLQTLEVYALGDEGHWVLLDALEGDAPVRQRPFDAIEFPLTSLWA